MCKYFDNQFLDCNIKKYAVRKRSMANPVHKQFEKNLGKPKATQFLVEIIEGQKMKKEQKKRGGWWVIEE